MQIMGIVCYLYPGYRRVKCVKLTSDLAVLKKPYKPVEIEICNVTRFSYGEMTDGEYVIWAQGKAGWFEIQPAPAYRAIYDDMVQAVEILYFVTDIYNEPRKRGHGPSAPLIFQEVSGRSMELVSGIGY